MKSIAYIPGSDGSDNASLMTVQSQRSVGATTILVNTTLGVPAKFYGSMGTPHTFQDPVTGETITVISEETAVDFAGRVDSGNIEIEEIAPGYEDKGSEVGDIIVIRPVAEWANNLKNVLDESHNDDGTLKADTVDEQAIEDDAVTPEKRSGGFAAGIIRQSAAGNYSVTGLEFKPKMIQFNAVRSGGGMNVYSQTGLDGGSSYGVAIDTNGDGTPDKQFGLASNVRAGTANAVARIHDNRSILSTQSNNDGTENSNRIEGAVTSMNDDGFDYNLTMAHDTVYVIWTAFG